MVHITDDPEPVFDMYRPFVALYAGGMGSEDTNFHADAIRRLGFDAEVEKITELFRSGRKEEAAAAVPNEMIEAMAIIGNEDHVRSEVRKWEEAGITTMCVTAGSVDEIRALARLI